MQSPKYVAEISPVEEVVLTGTADLEYWRQRLKEHGVQPTDAASQAQLVLTAVAGKFKGVRFRELSISIHADGPHGEGVFLTHAFNSSWLFAWCERTFFGTPYVYADVQLDTASPAIFATTSSGVKLEARAPQSPEPAAPVDECWEGPIYLPRRPNDNANRHFWAKLAGPKRIFPASTEDTCKFQSAEFCPALDALNESNFTPQQWSIRTEGTHARSKTLR